MLTARAEIGAHRSVAVVAVHLLPPYSYPPHEWPAEIRRLRPLLRRTAAGGTPVVAAGDFNATTDNAHFRGLLSGDATSGIESSRYEDTAEHAGAGHLATYPTDRWFGPRIAIDHVLTHGAEASNAATVALPGSDHRGLLLNVALSRWRHFLRGPFLSTGEPNRDIRPEKRKGDQRDGVRA